MKREDMLSVLDKYVAYVEKHDYEGQINLTGGEPLLHPDFMFLAAEIRKRGLRLGILTNGTLITDEIAGQLASLHPVFVQVSLDGPRRIHDEIRGEGCFDKALAGIDCLKRQGVRVLVSFTAMKDNWASFRELAKICRAHRVDKLWWDRVVTDDPALFLTTEEFRALSKTAARLSRWYRFISNDRALQWIPRGTCGYECSAGKRLLVVLPDGSLMACRRLPFVIGNIGDDEEMARIVDGNPIMRQLARPAFPPKCVKCRHFFFFVSVRKCVTYAQTVRIDGAVVNRYL